MKIQAGIFFGGPSRERERSFISGRTVYDNLDRALFDPIPFFIDSDLNLIRLDWQALYRQEIRDFFPPLEDLPSSPHAFRVYSDSLPSGPGEGSTGLAGQRVSPDELPGLINLAFLAMPGTPGGKLQRLLAELRIPFTGCHAEGWSALSSRNRQRELLAKAGLSVQPFHVLDRNAWVAGDHEAIYRQAIRALGSPLLICPAHESSPIGTSVVDSDAGTEVFGESVDKALFRETIPLQHWRQNSEYDKIDHLRLLTEPHDGLGFPLDAMSAGERTLIHHPEQLLEHLNRKAAAVTDPRAVVQLESRMAESQVIIMGLAPGRAFSCLVMRGEEGQFRALVPCVRRYGAELLDFKDDGAADDLPDDLQPVPVSADQANAIRQACVQAAQACGGGLTAAWVDGLITADGRVFIDEVNPQPALSSSGIFFQQFAAIGLTPSQALTYLIRTSLLERIREQPQMLSYSALLKVLDEQRAEQRATGLSRKKVAILCGGTEAEAALSLENGRNIFEKLLGSGKYDPIPVFVTEDSAGSYQLYQLPPGLMLLHDVAELRRRLHGSVAVAGIDALRGLCRDITRDYGSADVSFEPAPVHLADLREWVDVVFVALSGSPGTGRLQADLESLNLPFTGPAHSTMRLASDRYRGLQVLRQNGLTVPEQVLLRRSDFEADPNGFIQQVESRLSYPFIAKPAGERWKNAVRAIHNRSELQAYSRLLFRPAGQEGLDARYVLRLRPREPFPRQEAIFFQAQVSPSGARRLLEVSGSLLTLPPAMGSPAYVVLEPSELLDSSSTPSLEEQYQSRGGRYLTPARFARDQALNRDIAGQVKATMEKAARILNLQGAVSFDAFVRLYEGTKAETVIFDINPLPALTSGSGLLEQAAHQGYSPLQVMGALIESSLQRTEPAPAESLPDEEAFFAEPPISEPSLKPMPDPTPLHQPYQEPTPPPDSRPSFRLPGRFSLLLQQTAGLLRSPYFLKNFGVLLGFIILLFFLVTLVLNVYTHHGESLQVQDYRGMSIDEARRKARSRSFRIVISDSVFMVDRAPNIVLEQDPVPFTRVKENRRIYLTVTSSTAPKVLLPDLEGAYNYDTYQRRLMRLGLRPVIQDRQFDPKLEENTILYFYYNGQKITEADLRKGVKIPKGSQLEFVVTERMTDQIPAPSLICLPFEEAKFVISNYGLLLGDVVGDLPDQDKAYVYLQEPDAGTMIRKGEQINVYLSLNKPADCPETVPEQRDSLQEDQFEERRR